jgi:HD superfamily phosphodiesterase
MTATQHAATVSGGTRPNRERPVAGVLVPDSKMALAATELVRDTAGDLIFHHSRRVFFFGSLQGRHCGLSFNPELLYIGAMFHDLGLSQRFRGSGRRFEVDSADEARRFMQSYAIPEDIVRRVWTAIALHTTPGIPEHLEAEVALVAAGVRYDVLGLGYYDIGIRTRLEITARHPRSDFKRQILQAFANGMEARPETTYGTVMADVLEHSVPDFPRENFVQKILTSPWPD